jgi:hypothetical protein
MATHPRERGIALLEAHKLRELPQILTNPLGVSARVLGELMGAAASAGSGVTDVSKTLETLVTWDQAVKTLSGCLGLPEATGLRPCPRRTPAVPAC